MIAGLVLAVVTIFSVLRSRSRLTVGYTAKAKSYLSRIGGPSKRVFFEDSASLITALNEGEVDLALFEGKIKSSEFLDDFQEILLEDGLVLVSHNAKKIELEELKQMPVHTHLDEELLGQYFVELENVTYHDSFGKAAVAGLSQALLVRWSDYHDEFSVVEVLEDGEEFLIPSAPFLYYYIDLDPDRFEID